MKTNSIFAASACIASLAMATSLTSCSNDEMIVDEPQIRNEIRFNVTNNRTTRANLYYAQTADIQNFKVSAWVRGKEGEGFKAANFGSESNGNSAYFTEEVMTLESGAWNYQNGLLRYWPNNGEVLDFYSWVDYNEKSDGEGNKTRESVGSQFSWEGEFDTDTKRPKLSVTTKLAAAEMNNLLVASEDSKTQGTKTGSTKAELNFSHALAQVGVKVKVENPKIQMQIAEVALVNVPTTGDFYFDTPDAADMAEWKRQANPNTVTATIAAKPMVEQDNLVDLTGTDNTFMVIPTSSATTAAEGGTNISGDKVTSGTCFRIKCKIWNIANGNGEKPKKNDNDLLIYGENTENGFTYLYVPASFDWKMGTRYIYTISFGTGNAGFDTAGAPTLVKMDWTVNVSDWTSGTATDPDNQ